jgi:hypothetical protein
LTLDELREAMGAVARLMHFAGKKKLMAFDWYERETLRARLTELGVEVPDGSCPLVA